MTEVTCVRTILVMKTNTQYMVTSNNYGLHNNNVSVAKDYKDIGLGYVQELVHNYEKTVYKVQYNQTLCTQQFL